MKPDALQSEDRSKISDYGPENAERFSVITASLLLTCSCDADLLSDLNSLPRKRPPDQGVPLDAELCRFTLYIYTGEPHNVIGNFCFQKSAANSNEFPDPSALYLLQDRGVCASAAQRKLDAVLLLQGHRWGSAWSLLARIDLQRWLIMRVWFDVAEHPLLSQGWWRSLLLSQLSALMDELSTSHLRCCLPTYLILHPEMLQPLVGMLITLHALWLG